MDVALISSLGAGCYDCPVMRAVAGLKQRRGAVRRETHRFMSHGDGLKQREDLS